MPHRNPDQHPAVALGVTEATSLQSVTLTWFDKLEKQIRNLQYMLHEVIANEDADGVFVTDRVNGLDGGKVSATVSPSMAVQIKGGVFFVDDVPFKLTSDVTTPVLVAPVTSDRIDVVAASAEDDAFVILTGDEESTPVAPTVEVGMVKLAELYLRPGMTTIEDEETSSANEGYVTDFRYLLNA